jgi:hypothetical protein
VDAIRLHYRLVHGRLPDLAAPLRFTEKVQARKLSQHRSPMIWQADKALVKSWVADLLGPDWITPTFWAGVELPPRADRTWPAPYVIKANNGSGNNTFVMQEGPPDWDLIEAKLPPLNRWHGRSRGEWVYQRISPQYLVEPFIGRDGHSPDDFKIFVFHGRAEFIQVDTGRFAEHERTFFDVEWRKLPFSIGYPSSNKEIERPHSLEEMIRGAELLGRQWDFVRVDFYEIDHRPRFGEVTFYSFWETCGAWKRHRNKSERRQ